MNGFAKQHVAAQPIMWLDVPAKCLVTSLCWRVSGFYQRSVWCWFGTWTAVLGVNCCAPSLWLQSPGLLNGQQMQSVKQEVKVIKLIVYGSWKRVGGVEV